MRNFPVVSSPFVMRDFPEVRHLERDTLLEYVTPGRGHTVLDIQAAGGYLSDEIYRRLGGDVSCYCLEPCAELAIRLNREFTWINNPVEKFFSVADNSIDIALGLAGLHHSSSHAATIAETFRVLKPGGQLAICDVEKGSNVARWLNGYVDENSPAGHSGNFLEPGTCARLLKAAGFTSVIEEVRRVPWIYDRRETIAGFCKGLFGLSVSTMEIDRELERYFTVEESHGGVQIDWQLIYCYGEKPLHMEQVSLD